MTKVKKGDLVLVKFSDHSLVPKGVDKDKEIVVLNVAGRVYSARGKQIVLETWWADNEGFEHNHEWAKVLKSTIISAYKLDLAPMK